MHLRRLRDLYAREGHLPSYQHLAKALGFQAKNAAYKLAQRLIASGHLQRMAGGRLAPGAGFFGFDLSDDEIRAGFNSETSGTGMAQDQALNQLLVTRPSRTVLVRVRGESMVNAGIHSGDVAVVETGVRAAQGDIVVAEIDQAHTIKEYRVISGKPCLVPHGIQTEAVVPQKSLNIIGVVRGIVRSYRPQADGPAKVRKQGASR